MHVYSVYCGIRDEDVFVTLDQEPAADLKAELQDLAITCSRYCYGPVCSSEFCPHFTKDGVRRGVRSKAACTID